jgi:hypothetical protein
MSVRSKHARSVCGTYGGKEQLIQGHSEGGDRHLRMTSLLSVILVLYSVACTNGLRLHFAVLLMMGVNGTRNM